MSDQFYRAFEERYYAPRNVIKELRRQYLPFIEPLTTTYPGAQTYDAGCGRGEWLELMLERGFSPVGVDLDEGMLAACKEKNLPGNQGDAVQYLLDFDDRSLAVVSAFHVVEHIDFDALRRFVHHAWRVLKPGGLLIMETPNPENIIVATRNFYLDPTHQKPIPTQLLSFLAENEGFKRVKTLRLQESKELTEKEKVTLQEVFSGASPDYAVIAQKDAEPAFLEKFDALFERDYGLSLDELLGRWDRRFVKLEKEAEQAVSASDTAVARALEAAAKANEAMAVALAEKANVDALVNSTSWKITAPLRLVGEYVKKLKSFGSRSQLRVFLQHASLYVERRPRLKQLVLRVLDRFPSLKIWLAGEARRPMGVQSSHLQQAPLELTNLNPRAREIYQDLKAASGQLQKEGQ
ncbi:methyltransferase type 11 [Marinobacter sp. Z-F4-2]|nr:methyltransferase type 11 [Marinobacter sp. Z-F4-2]